MKKRTKRLLYLVVVIAIVAAVAGTMMSGGSDNLTSVQADLAITDDIKEIVTASGRIQPQTQVDITSEVSAQIIALLVKEGDRVEAGQRLIVLDTIQLQSDVSQAKYRLDEITARAEAARTQLEIDRLEAERQASLFEQDLTSETDATNARLRYENSRANYNAVLAQVETARAALAKAEDNLTKTSIKAPMAGVVTYLAAEVGEIAQAQTAFTQGKTLMTISDLAVFEVEVDVDETEIGKVALGDDATIRVDAYRDTTFAGTVVEIGNSALVQGQGTENYATSFRVKVRFAETDYIFRPGMSATVDITTATAEDALLIPYAAVVTREFDTDSLDITADKEKGAGGLVQSVNAAQEQESREKSSGDRERDKERDKEKVKKTGVFVIKNGTANFIEITTGIADERNIVAKTGLAPGDTIVSGSYQTLRRIEDGEAVKIEQRSIERIDDQVKVTIN